MNTIRGHDKILKISLNLIVIRLEWLNDDCDNKLSAKCNMDTDQPKNGLKQDTIDRTN